MKKEIQIYYTKTGKAPFVDWIESLKDLIGIAKIKSRLNRVSLGNYGDCEPVSNGIYELKIHFGPGYRIYFSEIPDSILLLLIGGNIRSQKQDIKKAKEY